MQNDDNIQYMPMDRPLVGRMSMRPDAEQLRTMRHAEILAAVQAERAYQIAKYGDAERPLAEWLLIVRRETNEALDAWANVHGDAAALAELLQVATVIFACFEQHSLVPPRLDTRTDVPSSLTEAHGGAA